MTTSMQPLDRATLARWVRPEAQSFAALHLGVGWREGYADRFLDEADLVALERERMLRGAALSDVERRILDLPPERYGEIASMIGDDEDSLDLLLNDESATGPWLFAGLSAIAHRWHDVDEPLFAVSGVLEDLGLVRPPWDRFLYFTPAPRARRRLGATGIRDEIAAWLDHRSAEFGFPDARSTRSEGS